MSVEAIGIEMNISTVRSLLTLVLFLAFIVLWAWAWSKNRQPDFERMARLPLEEGDVSQGEPR